MEYIAVRYCIKFRLYIFLHIKVTHLFELQYPISFQDSFHLFQPLFSTPYHDLNYFRLLKQHTGRNLHLNLHCSDCFHPQHVLSLFYTFSGSGLISFRSYTFFQMRAVSFFMSISTFFLYLYDGEGSLPGCLTFC